jgi:predicted RNA-binding Zn-ribbon protein involved in translation (DUF1610 family)
VAGNSFSDTREFFKELFAGNPFAVSFAEETARVTGIRLAKLGAGGLLLGLSSRRASMQHTPQLLTTYTLYSRGGEVHRVRPASEEGWLDATRQRWKARVAYSAAAIQVVALCAIFVVDRAHRMTAFWLALGALAMFAAFSVSVRCRACGAHVLIWSLKHERPLSSLQECPECGSRSDKIETGKPPTLMAGPTSRNTSFSLERVTRSPGTSWVVYLAVGMLAVWVIRWLWDLFR